MTIETDRTKVGSNPIVRQSQFVGETQERSLIDSKLTINRGQAPPLAPATASFDAQGNVVLRMEIITAIPLVTGAPEINVSLIATVDPSGESFDVSAGLDGFPTTAAAVVTAEGEQIPIFIVEGNGASRLAPLNLYPGVGDQQLELKCTPQGCQPE